MNTQYAINVPLVFTCESSLLSWFLISRLVNSGRGLSHMRVYGRGHLCKNRTQRWAHHMGCGRLWAGASRRVCLLPWLRCSFIHGCVIIYAFTSEWKSFRDVDSNHKRSYRFWNIHRVYARSVFVYCMWCFQEILNGAAGRVLGWHTI